MPEETKPVEVAEAKGDENELMPEDELNAADETGAKFELVKTVTGEEEEEVVWETKCKAYRFDDGENEFKERGVGMLKFLRHKEDKKVRIMMRRDQIHKVCIALSLAEVGPLALNTSNDKAYVFTGHDYSEEDEDVRESTLCVKFTSLENAKLFKKHFEDLGGPKASS